MQPTMLDAFAFWIPPLETGTTNMLPVPKKSVSDWRLTTAAVERVLRSVRNNKEGKCILLVKGGLDRR